MAHWNAYYESSQTSDDQYPSLSTTVSAAASHFKSRMPGDEFGHAVANISGAFAGSQPRRMMMQPGYNQHFENFYCTASPGPDTYCDTEEGDFNGETNADDDIQILDDSHFKDPPQSPCSSSVAYTLKIIHPRRKTSDKARKWDVDVVFTDIADLKRRLLQEDDVDDIQDGEELTFGYLQPGHGIKGRQFSLLNSSDLSAMYSIHHGRKQINMWAKISKIKAAPPPQKRQRRSPVTESLGKTSVAAGPSKYIAQQQKMTELEVIVSELSEQHGNSYTTEQVRAWAHMLQMKKHDSYEEPPKKSFFKTAEKGAPSKASVSDTMSPGKRIQYRSQCIDQLDKWHDLKERGIITDSQYAEMQDTILSDIKKF